ncbi:hypothetical protein F4780DRAFT_330413 [Xylariomycetidae sp. FL0641]|nr:hypothetical protein F4780DRAFT_330413 [Xylariomycetidae sp. FL0641]
MSLITTYGRVVSSRCIIPPSIRRVTYLTTFREKAERGELYTRLSRTWIPSGGITPTQNEDTHEKLIRAGFLRQAHAGIFHMLPLGQRVQQKIEKLIEKYMSQLVASEVSLSTVSSQALWKKTNRLDSYGPELFRFGDRKEAQYLLAPTHEEEITSLVAKSVRSYKNLPLRLYQINRKYRDELRPRQGLLRSREFVMKDLYTFDYSRATALRTYAQVRDAYSSLFDELKLPYLVAEASSGDIGGDLSHEYHLPSRAGEDNVISCMACDYVANEELAVSRPEKSSSKVGEDSRDLPAARTWRGVTKDRTTLINVWYPGSLSEADINVHSVKTIVPGLDSGLEDPSPFWQPTSDKSSPLSSPQRLLNVVDYRLGSAFAAALEAGLTSFPLIPPTSNLDMKSLQMEFVSSSSERGLVNTIRIRDGDSCPRCDEGNLKVQKTIELGHTFHLGTRYSEPLEARVQVPTHLVAEGSGSPSSGPTTVPIQMGCHGIGVSRIIAAVADHLADDKGLNWPAVIAPYEVVVIPGPGLDRDQGAMQVADRLADEHPNVIRGCELLRCNPPDILLDDRPGISLSWKMKDADLIGYPIIVIVGKHWEKRRYCEVQCRRLSVKATKSLDELAEYVTELLWRL